MANHSDTITTNPPPKLKQAVVIIHGMGEQHPMETIREFVNHVWKQDSQLEYPHFWNKPSTVSKSFEQRRLTTDSPKIKNSNARVCRTDFYEYYWAHNTVDTKWEHFLGWFQTFLKCWPSKYNDHPKTLKPFWYILWTLLIVAGLSIIGWLVAIYFINKNCEENASLGFLLGILITAIEIIFVYYLSKAKRFFIDYFGDVGRYVRAKPSNISIRQSIRQGGIELLVSTTIQ
jgi:hypothetical protein